MHAHVMQSTHAGMQEHAKSRGVWGMSPRKFCKFTLSEIESKSNDHLALNHKIVVSNRLCTILFFCKSGGA